MSSIGDGYQELGSPCLTNYLFAKPKCNELQKMDHLLNGHFFGDRFEFLQKGHPQAAISSDYFQIKNNLEKNCTFNCILLENTIEN